MITSSEENDILLSQKQILDNQIQQSQHFLPQLLYSQQQLPMQFQNPFFNQPTPLQNGQSSLTNYIPSPDSQFNKGFPQDLYNGMNGQFIDNQQILNVMNIQPVQKFSIDYTETNTPSFFPETQKNAQTDEELIKIEDNEEPIVSTYKGGAQKRKLSQIIKQEEEDLELERDLQKYLIYKKMMKQQEEEQFTQPLFQYPSQIPFQIGNQQYLQEIPPTCEDQLYQQLQQQQTEMLMYQQQLYKEQQRQEQHRQIHQIIFNTNQNDNKNNNKNNKKIENKNEGFQEKKTQQQQQKQKLNQNNDLNQQIIQNQINQQQQEIFQNNNLQNNILNVQQNQEKVQQYISQYKNNTYIQKLFYNNSLNNNISSLVNSLNDQQNPSQNLYIFINKLGINQNSQQINLENILSQWQNLFYLQNESDQTIKKLPRIYQPGVQNQNGENNTENQQNIKNTSKFHNRNKLFINGLIRFFTKENIQKLQMPSTMSNVLFQVMDRARLSGRLLNAKKVLKTDLFNHSHYNLLFQKLNEKTCQYLKKSEKDVNLHKQIFDIDISDENICQTQENMEKIELINFLKQCIYFIVCIHLKNDIVNFTSEQDSREYEQRAFNGIAQMIDGNIIQRF